MNKTKVENSNILSSLSTCAAGPERTRHIFSLNFGNCVGDFNVVYDFNPCDTVEVSPSRLTVILGDATQDTGFIGNSFFNEQLNDLGFPNVSAGIGLVKGSLSIVRQPGDPEVGKVIIDTPFQSSSVEFYLECPEGCSDSDSDSDSDSLGNSANYQRQAVWGEFGEPAPTTVGSNGGPSAYGTYDQTGNAYEWTDLDALPGPVRTIRNMWYRGGDALSDGTPMIGARSARALNVPGAVSYSSDGTQIGFGIHGFRIASRSNPLNLDLVLVGDAGNVGDSRRRIANFNPAWSFGSVGYDYYIGKYAITNCEYVEFLNAIATDDTYKVAGILLTDRGIRPPPDWTPPVSSARIVRTSSTLGSPQQGIIKNGSEGNYTYTLFPNTHNKPVMFLTWFDCARYCNWLHNGRPTGPQNSSTTEDGAYTLNGRMYGDAVARNDGALYHIPTEDEWYKAAYYKSGSLNAGYWDYATQSNEIPTTVTADAEGNGSARISDYVCPSEDGDSDEDSDETAP